MCVILSSHLRMRVASAMAESERLTRSPRLKAPTQQLALQTQDRNTESL